jgi:hypothetical protein
MCSADIGKVSPILAANTTTLAPCGSEEKSETGRVKLSGVQDHADKAQVVGGEELRRSWEQGRDAVLEHVRWIESHGKVRMEQSKTEKDLHAFNAGRVDAAESIIIFATHLEYPGVSSAPPKENSRPTRFGANSQDTGTTPRESDKWGEG